jgi:hypothetical protein
VVDGPPFFRLSFLHRSCTFNLGRSNSSSIIRTFHVWSTEATSKEEEAHDPAGGGKAGSFGKLRKLAAEHGIKVPDVVLSYVVGAVSASAGAKGFTRSAAMAGLAPKAVHAILERLEPPKDLPHLALVRGVQAIEYEDGMVAQAFESR